MRGKRLSLEPHMWHSDFLVKTIRQIQRLTNSNLPVKAQQCSSLRDQDDAGNALCFLHHRSSRNSGLYLLKFLSKINTALATGRSSSGGWGCPSPRELLWRFFSCLHFSDPFCGVGHDPQIASGRWRGQRAKSKNVVVSQSVFKENHKKLCSTTCSCLQKVFGFISSTMLPF